MKNVSALLVLLFTLNTYANNCGYSAPEKTLECKGTFKAKSYEDIGTYLSSNYGEKNGFHRNILFDGDFTLDSGVISTPCKVIFQKAKKFEFNGTSCAYGKEGVTLRAGSSLKAGDLTLSSDKRVLVRDNTTITGSSLKLLSL